MEIVIPGIIIDVTCPLSGKTIVYPGDQPPWFKQEERGQYLISDLRLSSHTGTHIDAPVHYLKRGDTIDTIPLSYLIGQCQVLDLSDSDSAINKDLLESRIRDTERILIKTSFSYEKEFREDYPHLTLEAAKLITKAGIKCVGIDSPSIETLDCDGSVHRELLSHDCIIIELLDLSAVQEGLYDMVALPLRLQGLDGSPARVVLFKRE